MNSAYQGCLLLMATVLLTGCASPIRVSPTIPVTSPVVITTTPTHLPSATVQPTSTLTPLPSENILKFQPFEIRTDLPPYLDTAGALLLEIRDSPPKLLYFTPKIKLETIPGLTDEGCLSTSPDGKWLTQCTFAGTNSVLIIQTVDGQDQRKIPLIPYASILYEYPWLNNQQLLFTAFHEEGQAAAAMVVANPFTGQQTELDSNYPHLVRSPDGPAGTMAFNLADVVYDPSLKLVVYPSSGERSFITVWNRQSKSVITKFESGTNSYPLWSPDGKQLAISTSTHYINDKWLQVSEWFLISQEGQVEQLTHFGDYFTTAEISFFSKWSPDGKKLAFWLETSPSLCAQGPQLAVLDITTKQVTNTCLAGTSSISMVSTPIWSLNSQYIVTENEKQKFLVDIKQELTFDITRFFPDASVAIGWLALP
jgi:hypothetical protein